MTKPHNDMPVEAPSKFEELFDENGEVITTKQGKQELQPQPEAPYTHVINNTQQLGAEFNVFFKNDGGFKCHLKLHGPTGRDVLETAAGALAYLAANNFTPEYATAVAATQAEVTRQDLPQDGTASQTTCPIHHVPMKRRTSQFNDDVWYSHKTDDPGYKDKDGWCRGV